MFFLNYITQMGECHLQHKPWSIPLEILFPLYPSLSLRNLKAITTPVLQFNEIFLMFFPQSHRANDTFIIHPGRYFIKSFSLFYPGVSIKFLKAINK